MTARHGLNLGFEKSKEDTMQIAKELCYGKQVFKRLQMATTESELTRIMHDAREAM